MVLRSLFTCFCFLALACVNSTSLRFVTKSKTKYSILVSFQIQRSLGTCSSRLFYLSLQAALFFCYMAPFYISPCLSFLLSSFSCWTISPISYPSLFHTYLVRGRLLLFVSPFLSFSSIRIFRFCKLSSPFFSPLFLLLSYIIIPSSLWTLSFKTSLSPKSLATLFTSTLYLISCC